MKMTMSTNTLSWRVVFILYAYAVAVKIAVKYAYENVDSLEPQKNELVQSMPYFRYMGIAKCISIDVFITV